MIAGSHATVTEMQSAIRTAKAFINARKLHDLTILLRSDATTTVSYFNRQGGRRHHLAKWVAEFLVWCWDVHRIQFVAAHIKGIHNCDVDQLSRKMNPWAEIYLDTTAFTILERTWGPHTIDLMVTSVNTKHPRYFSWNADPGSAATKAMSQDWRLETNPYIFPPNTMIVRCAQKGRDTGCTLTIVTQLWPAKHWVPILMKMSCDWPLLLATTGVIRLTPILRHESTNPFRSMIGWRISGDDYRVHDFKRGASNCSYPTGRAGQEVNIWTEGFVYGHPTAGARAAHGRILARLTSSTGSLL